MAYSSKYYDPVKAHEYYMKHRKLKGRKKRTSTKGLNEEGKSAAKYIKEQIMEERKQAYAQLREMMKQKIKELKESMQGKSKEEIDNAVNELKGNFKAVKEQVKDAYEEKYAQELDGLKADSKFSGGSKKRVSRKKKKSR